MESSNSHIHIQVHASSSVTHISLSLKYWNFSENEVERLKWISCDLQQSMYPQFHTEITTQSTRSDGMHSEAKAILIYHEIYLNSSNYYLKLQTRCNELLIISGCLIAKKLTKEKNTRSTSVQKPQCPIKCSVLSPMNQYNKGQHEMHILAQLSFCSKPKPPGPDLMERKKTLD